jgi:hypothetical protein
MPQAPHLDTLHADHLRHINSLGDSGTGMKQLRRTLQTARCGHPTSAKLRRTTESLQCSCSMPSLTLSGQVKHDAAAAGSEACTSWWQAGAAQKQVDSRVSSTSTVEIVTNMFGAGRLLHSPTALSTRSNMIQDHS